MLRVFVHTCSFVGPIGTDGRSGNIDTDLGGFMARKTKIVPDRNVRGKNGAFYVKYAL
jgi:hypothetical protein